MTNDLMCKCGEALYGPRWQRELAAALDVDERTMRRWVAGDSPVPDGVNVDLLRLLTERADEIDDLIPKLKRE